MKNKILLIITSLVSLNLSLAQQCTTLSKSCSYGDDLVGLVGVGNINTESFEKANASGKLSAYVRLFDKDKLNKDGEKIRHNTLTFYLSLNKNVTRNDSLSIKSILYPDLGNNAFQGTLEYSVLLNGNKEESEPGHYIAPFVEGWIKDFKIGSTDSTTNRFVTVNASVGLRYIWHFEKEKEKDGEDNVFFSVASYYTLNKVLEKDKDDFYNLTTEGSTGVNNPLHYNSIGLKFALEYNKFQFFIDMRNTFGGDEIPSREIKGFSYNIGFVTSANILGAD